MKKVASIIFTLIYVSLFSYSQSQYKSMIDFPILLSANFGELRPNHFHSGIDVKTQGVINKPVYSIMNGYISRVSIAPGGYGLAIYVAHPNGQTSVYGHLNRFTPKVTKYIKEKQYEQESYKIDINIAPTIFPVKKGDLIAYSGNTGSSGGPHIHFEIRDTKTEMALDPLVYYMDQIKDTQSPLVKGVAVYPIIDKGSVNSNNKPFRQRILTLKNGTYTTFPDNINAWGTVGFGIFANDKMNETNNIYGIKRVQLFCDDKEISSYNISNINFSKTRMINSLTDYSYWVESGIFYMKSFIEDGNKLPYYKASNNGYLNINEERVYNLRYELEDLYGNKTSYNFSITGKKQDIIEEKGCSQVMVSGHDNFYISNDFSLIIPKGKLYDNICFKLIENKSQEFLSNIYTLHDRHTPLDSMCEMKIGLTKDPLTNKNQYGIVRLRNGKTTWVGGSYEKGFVKTQIRELGDSYAISIDNTTPIVTPLQPNKWVASKTIKIRLSDNLSGINSFRGTIDGEFILFEHDVKSTIYTYKFDDARLKKTGKKRVFKLIAVDFCGNETAYEYIFSY